MITAAILARLTPEEGAALWLANGGPDAIAEAGLFDRWVEERDENWDAWERAFAVWDSFELVEPREIAPLLAEARTAAPEPGNDRWRWAAVASVAFVAVSAGLLVLPKVSTTGGASQAPSVARFGTPDYQTRPGETRVATLPDGSRLALASDSAVDIAFADGRRDLRLVRGTADFGVAHDAAHPFAVQAGGQIVTALGTHFTVALKPSSVSVLLKQGSISVVPSDTSRGTGVILTPGQRFDASADGPGKVTLVANIAESVASARTVVFRNQPLFQVAEIMGGPEHRLIVRDTKVGGLRVSGTFQTGEIGGFVRAIEGLYPVRVVPAAQGKMEIVPAR